MKINTAFVIGILTLLASGSIALTTMFYGSTKALYITSSIIAIQSLSIIFMSISLEFNKKFSNEFMKQFTEQRITEENAKKEKELKEGKLKGEKKLIEETVLKYSKEGKPYMFILNALLQSGFEKEKIDNVILNLQKRGKVKIISNGGEENFKDSN